MGLKTFGFILFTLPSIGMATDADPCSNGLGAKVAANARKAICRISLNANCLAAATAATGASTLAGSQVANAVSQNKASTVNSKFKKDTKNVLHAKSIDMKRYDHWTVVDRSPTTRSRVTEYPESNTAEPNKWVETFRSRAEMLDHRKWERLNNGPISSSLSETTQYRADMSAFDSALAGLSKEGISGKGINLLSSARYWRALGVGGEMVAKGSTVLFLYETLAHGFGEPGCSDSRANGITTKPNSCESAETLGPFEVAFLNAPPEEQAKQIRINPQICPNLAKINSRLEKTLAAKPLLQANEPSCSGTSGFSTDVGSDANSLHQFVKLDPYTHHVKELEISDPSDVHEYLAKFTFSDDGELAHVDSISRFGAPVPLSPADYRLKVASDEKYQKINDQFQSFQNYQRKATAFCLDKANTSALQNENSGRTPVARVQ